MDDMVCKWGSLSLTSSECEVLDVSEELVELGRSRIKLGLVGKLLTDKIFSKVAFSETIRKLWRVNKGVEIKFLSANRFHFKFKVESEIDRILSSEPWHFNRALLVLKKSTGFNLWELGPFQFTNFWVQVHNIPPEGMIEEIGVLIGNMLGKCIKVEADEDKQCTGPFMRLRVLIDTTEPLRRVLKIAMGAKRVLVRVDLKYELLPYYCYACGLLGHVAKECEVSLFDPTIKYADYPFGPWLKSDYVTSPAPSSSRSSVEAANVLHLENTCGIDGSRGGERSLGSFALGPSFSPMALKINQVTRKMRHFKKTLKPIQCDGPEGGKSPEPAVEKRLVALDDEIGSERRVAMQEEKNSKVSVGVAEQPRRREP